MTIFFSELRKIIKLILPCHNTMLRDNTWLLYYDRLVVNCPEFIISPCFHTLDNVT